MRVVLLGATGFVGSAIARRLSERHAVVHALVRGQTMRVQSAGITAIAGELSDAPATLFPGEPFVLVHFATKQRHAEGEPAEALVQTNVGGTERVLAALPRWCVGLVYGSSLSVYGAGRQAGFLETQTVRPTTALAETRAAAEARILAEGRQRGIPAVVLRPRFVLGEGDLFTLPGLLRAFRRGVAIGDERQAFSIIDVRDYADVVVRLAERMHARIATSLTGPVHVGYRRPVTLAEIRTALGERFSLPAARRRVPMPSVVARALSLLPPTRSLATTLELLAHDHWVSVEALAAGGFEDVVARDSLDVLRRAVLGLPEEPNA